MTGEEAAVPMDYGLTRGSDDGRLLITEADRRAEDESDEP